MKRICTIFLLLCLLLTVLPASVFATETTEAAEENSTRAANQCGADLTWSYDSGTLTISGSGEMDDYPDGDAPWLEYKDSITSLVVSGNVTSIGAGAFLDYDSLKEVDFGSAMHTIHRQAFKSCDGLTSITLPTTFRRFGEESFMGCSALTEITCRGGMPSFNGNCLWDTYCTVFYPSNNPWPAEPVAQLFQAFHGRIQFYMGEGTQQTAAPETQPVQTEATETVPETTVPETTVPETTVPETTVPETTQAETEAPQPQTTQPQWLQEMEDMQEESDPEEKKATNIWFALFLITGTLCLILIGALLFRRRSY